MDEISDQYISAAIDDLVKTVGVKENIKTNSLLELFKVGKTKECVEKIAEYLGLPIKVNLIYVPDDYRGGNVSQNFSSNSLVKTNERGRGQNGITAQVSMPEYIPMFGTSSLESFIIDVKISQNISNYPKTFIAIMSHELSHILLGSLGRKEKNNEIYTDLIR